MGRSFRNRLTSCGRVTGGSELAKLIDVSIPVGPGMLTWPGDPEMSIERVWDLERGEASNLSLLTMSTHTGTHVDPPVHFVPAGATIDQLPLEVFVGAAVVVDARGLSQIDASFLDGAGLPAGTPRVLFKTDWSARWDSDPAPTFPEAFTALSLDAARWLTDRRVRLVGTDFISVEGMDDPTYPVHRHLLGAGVVVVEGLDLREVKPGTCRFTCLPLKIRDGDGGPARAFVEQG